MADAPPSSKRPGQLLSGAGVRRAAVVLGAVLLALSVVALCAQAYLGSSAFRDRLLTRIRDALARHTGAVTVEEVKGVNLLGRVRIGKVSARARDGERAVIEIAEVTVRPSLRALLRGRVEPSRIHLREPRLHAGAGGRELWELVNELRGPPPPRSPGASAAAAPSDDPPAPAPAPAPSPRRAVRFSFEGGRLFLGPPGSEDELGPVDGALSFDQRDGRGQLEGRVGLVEGPALQLTGKLDEQRLELELGLPVLTAAAVPAAVRERLPFTWSAGELRGAVTLSGDPHLQSSRLHVSLVADALVLESERLAEVPVGPLHAAFELRTAWDRKRSRLELERLEVSVGKDREIVAHASGHASFSDWTFAATGQLGPLQYAPAVGALPVPLRPPPEAPAVTGELAGRAAVFGPVMRPEEWAVEVQLDLRKLVGAGKVALDEPFRHEASSQEQTRTREVGPDNPSFVPVAELPPYVVRAVTTAEDAGFFAHRGFDFSELTLSIVEAARAERVRGASTISQQLAKNLFLSRERTFARKVREALVTVALEATVSKQRLIEIYLNIIEWGPGIFGIGEAAHHYFGVDARKLTVKQAAFLATLIPNPVKYHVYFTRGALTEHWQKRVDELLARLHELQVIDEAQLAAATAEALVFRVVPSETAPRRAPPTPRR